MTYLPKPIDTTSIVFTRDLDEAAEKIASNTHEIWAAQRIAQGWVHGPQRNDATKEHPCLVPYDQLPDSEKEYDRKVTRETIKALLAMGWRIEKP